MSYELTPGTLYVVATPIGNLSDLSARAQDVLAQVDAIVAEDTRHTKNLLRHLSIDKPLTASHKFNEASRVQPLLDRLGQGHTLALVSDAGTPGISDPGARLVAAAHEAGHRVEPIAGPSAVITALSASGFDADRFYFGGFLPVKGSARRRELEALALLEQTVVLYEAPHRVVETLDDLVATVGDRPAVLCRELTKKFEEVVRARLSALRDMLTARDEVRGEIVLVLGPPDEPIDHAARERESRELRAAFDEALKLEDGDERRALRRLSRDRDLPRAELKHRLGL